MTDDRPELTGDLLRRWRAGDGEALGQLLARELPWIRQCVRRRLGPLVRRCDDSHDLVQDALVHVLRTGARLPTDDPRTFRRVVAAVVENCIRNRHRHMVAERRDVRREEVLPSDDPALRYGSRADAWQRPSRAAQSAELRALVAAALEMLGPEDRTVIVLRQYEGLEFAAIADRLGMSTDTARQRFRRALPKLLARLEELRLTGGTGADA